MRELSLLVSNLSLSTVKNQPTTAGPTVTSPTSAPVTTQPLSGLERSAAQAEINPDALRLVGAGPKAPGPPPSPEKTAAAIASALDAEVGGWYAPKILEHVTGVSLVDGALHLKVSRGEHRDALPAHVVSTFARLGLPELPVVVDVPTPAEEAIARLNAGRGGWETSPITDIESLTATGNRIAVKLTGDARYTMADVIEHVRSEVADIPGLEVYGVDNSADRAAELLAEPEHSMQMYYPVARTEIADGKVLVYRNDDERQTTDTALAERLQTRLAEAGITNVTIAIIPRTNEQRAADLLAEPEHSMQMYYVVARTEVANGKVIVYRNSNEAATTDEQLAARCASRLSAAGIPGVNIVVAQQTAVERAVTLLSSQEGVRLAIDLAEDHIERYSARDTTLVIHPAINRGRYSDATLIDATAKRLEDAGIAGLSIEVEAPTSWTFETAGRR